ncbi:hypothetical protein OESDEN_12307, partial [Oesophagostomum dentatum]
MNQQIRCDRLYGVRLFKWELSALLALHENKLGRYSVAKENTLISYYKCCGHLHKECCSHLRVWVLILIIALPLLLILPLSIYLLRRLLCKRRQHY